MAHSGAPRPGSSRGAIGAQSQYIACTLGATPYTVPNNDGTGVFPWRVETLKNGITHSVNANTNLFTIVTAGIYYVSAAFVVAASDPTEALAISVQLITPDSLVLDQGGDRFRSRIGGNWSADDLVVTVRVERLLQFVAGDRFRFALNGPTSGGGISVGADTGGESPSAWMQAFRVY